MLCFFDADTAFANLTHMNDLQTQTERSHLPESLQKYEGLWSKIIAFLNRDIKSFLRRGDKDRCQREQYEAKLEHAATTRADTLVESLVDHNRLSEMAFRREVLDWRDNFHANVTTTISRLQDTFIEEMHAELGNMKLFRKLLSRPSDEVLQGSFIRLVRQPLIAALREEEVKLEACVQKWGSFGRADLAFDTRRLSAECISLHDVGFKPSNKSLISMRVQTLMLGPAGVAEHFRDQALHVSRKLLEAKES